MYRGKESPRLFALAAALAILIQGMYIGNAAHGSSADGPVGQDILGSAAAGGGYGGVSVGIRPGSAAIFTAQKPPAGELDIISSYNTNTDASAGIYYDNAVRPFGTFILQHAGAVPAIWIETGNGWAWSAACPLQGYARELLYLPASGSVEVYEIYPGGQTVSHRYSPAGPGYYYIWFRGDVPGRHICLIAQGELPSNALVLDVVSSFPYGPAATGYSGEGDMTGGGKMVSSFEGGIPVDGTRVTGSGGSYSTTYGSDGSTTVVSRR